MENQEFKRQKLLMSRSPLDSTPINMDTTNANTSHMEFTPVGTNIPDPKPLTGPTESFKHNGKEHVPEDLSQNHHLQNHH